MVLAVIKTGGKQYLVSPGQKIKVEKLAIEAGKEVVFDEVLMVDKDNKTDIGTPVVKDAKVNGQVLSQGKADKKISFMYKNKTRHKTKKGFRQAYTEVEIKAIEMK